MVQLELSAFTKQAKSIEQTYLVDNLQVAGSKRRRWNFGIQTRRMSKKIEQKLNFTKQDFTLWIDEDSHLGWTPEAATDCQTWFCEWQADRKKR